MKFLISFLLLISASAFAAGTKMGPEAVEMFQVISHPQVRECLDRADVNMVNITIEKTVARCPGCNTYKITGAARHIDTPSLRGSITLTGKMVPATPVGFVQTYQC